MSNNKVSKIMNALSMAKGLCNSRDYEEALPLFDKAMKEEPLNYEVYESKGDAYLNLEEYSKAIAEYKKALELCPSRGYLKALIKESKKKLLADVDELTYRKKLNKALEISLSLKNLFPNDADVILTTGEVYFKMKQYPMTINLLKELLVFNVSDRTAQIAMVNIIFSMYAAEMYKECIKICIKAKERYDDILIDMNMADCYKELHDTPNSEKYYDIVAKKILKMNEKDLIKYASIVSELIKQSIKQKNYARQITLSKIYINKISKNPHAMIDLAEAYKEIGKYKEAIRVFEKTADYYSNDDAGEYAKEQIEMCKKLSERIR